MTFRRLWAVLAVLLPILGALIAGLSSTDLTYHLRAGAEMLNTGDIPRSDTWTYTVAGRPWLDQQWLAQLLLEGIYRVASWTGLAVLRAVLVGLVFGGVTFAIVRRGVDVRLATGLGIVAFFVAAPALALRPQLFGMALFTAVILLLTERHRHPVRLWLAVPILAVWANLHGSFVLGLALLGLAWLEDLRMSGYHAWNRLFGRHLALVVGLAAALATLVNPWGPGVWGYATGLVVDRNVTARVTEWQMTTLGDVPGILFYGSAVGVAMVLVRRREALRWPMLLALGVFFALGVYAVRGVAWWPIVAAVSVGTLLAPAPRPHGEPDRERTTPSGARRMNVVVSSGLVIACLALLPAWRPMDRGLGTPLLVVAQAPSGITGHLRGLVRDGDRLFVPQVWASWFEWTFPQTTVAVDSRIELFPAATWDAYDRVIDGGDGWQEQLGSWGVTVVVAAGDDAPGFATRLTNAGWIERYFDEDGRILVVGSRS